MSAQDHQINIEFAATISVEDDTPLPCSITLNLGEQNNLNQDNITFQDKELDHQDSKCKEALKSDTKQKNKAKSEANHPSGIIKELFGPPDDVSGETKNEDSHYADLGLKIVSNSPTAKSSKDSLSGGGTKPISTKQKNLIQKMANEQNKNADEVVNDMFNKPIDQLEGHEADSVIKSMKKSRR